MRPLNDPLPEDGVAIQSPPQKPEDALDEQLLGQILPRNPRGISRPTFGIARPAKSITAKSPAEIVAWFDKFEAAFGPSSAAARN